MITQYTVQNQEHVSDKAYEEVVATFEETVADAEYGKFTDALNAAQNAQSWEDSLTAMFGPSGFIHVFSIDHGRWLGFYDKPHKAKKWVYGNPIVAETMLRHDLRAGLQVPLSILIYEDEQGHARVSYDLPSSIMSFIDNPDLAAAAEVLDAKLVAFIENLTGASA